VDGKRTREPLLKGSVVPRVVMRHGPAYKLKVAEILAAWARFALPTLQLACSQLSLQLSLQLSPQSPL
jgi:hypothetical protein